MSVNYPHIEERENSYYIRGSRIPVITIIRAWEDGMVTPQFIQRSFSTLTLAEVYAAVAFYLDHKDMLDQHFADVRTIEAANIAAIDAANADFRAMLQQRFDALQAATIPRS